MEKNRSWAGGLLFGVLLSIFMAGLVSRHERHGNAQSSTQGSSGMPSPVPSGAGAPGTFFTCNAAFGNMQFVNTTTFGTSYCDGVNWNAEKDYLSGTTGTITGTLLAVGGADTGNVTIAGAVTGSNCQANASDGTAASAGTFIDCNVGSTNTVTVRIVAFVLGTPASKTYNVKVFN